MFVHLLSCCKRILFFIVLGSVMVSAGYAQAVTQMLNKADSLTRNGKDEAALQIYKNILQKDSTQKQALVSSGILLVRKGERQKKAKEAGALYAEAKQLALSALKKDPNYAPAAYAYALSLYNISVQLGVKEKIKGLRDVKEYLDRAVLLDSTYAKAWYLLGKWNMAFNKLNFAERAAVKILFGGMPKAGAAQAVGAYRQCRKLDASFIRNYYYLAQALHVDGQDLKAIAVLKEAIHLRPFLKDDRAFQQKCRELIDDLH